LKLSLVTMQVGIEFLSAIFRTPASVLLLAIRTTSATELDLKHSMILAALLPAPDAKMAIRFTERISAILRQERKMNP
jgi:hypothetical protein